MAKVDIVKYYNQVCKDYEMMLNELNEVEEFAKTHMVDPQIIDNIKNMTEPMRIRYNTITYFMYELNKPNRKDKLGVYEKQNTKHVRDLDKAYMLNKQLDENKKILEQVKEAIK